MRYDLRHYELFDGGFYVTIVVLTRSTPDTAAKVEVDGSGSVTWGDAATVVNPWDEYALEEAILQAKAAGTKAVVVAIGRNCTTKRSSTASRWGWTKPRASGMSCASGLASLRDRRRRRHPENRRR